MKFESNDKTVLFAVMVQFIMIMVVIVVSVLLEITEKV